jgi:hypothetical protein
MNPMTKRDNALAAPAQLAWQENEAELRAQAREWAKQTIDAWVFNDATYTPRTAAAFLAKLDVDPSQPEAWAYFNKPGTQYYTDRYSMVRNHLEGLARSKQVVCGTTINRNGVEGSTTYARARDVTKLWHVEIPGDRSGSIAQIIHVMLTTHGALLEASPIQGIFITRKQGRGVDLSEATRALATDKPGTTKARRKPRTTRGGD